MTYKVGDTVKVRKNNNAFGNYYPAEITNKTQGRVPGAIGWYGDTAVFCYYLCCCFCCSEYVRTQYYDVKFLDDGSEEKQVTEAMFE
mmetsp:Transcript_4619/g.6938  ORF Transcript_4619/g.6938 Transcript_4619/m.6938 type:complete len:87 (-) Transcript_4619:89-349(-)